MPIRVKLIRLAVVLDGEFKGPLEKREICASAKPPWMCLMWSRRKRRRTATLHQSNPERVQWLWLVIKSTINAALCIMRSTTIKGRIRFPVFNLTAVPWTPAATGGMMLCEYRLLLTNSFCIEDASFLIQTMTEFVFWNLSKLNYSLIYMTCNFNQSYSFFVLCYAIKHYFTWIYC